jgi:hypothetical protein
MSLTDARAPESRLQGGRVGERVPAGRPGGTRQLGAKGDEHGTRDVPGTVFVHIRLPAELPADVEDCGRTGAAELGDELVHGDQG